MTIGEITHKYCNMIGEPDSRVSFLHTAPAAEAADLLKQIDGCTYITSADYRFIIRIGQVLYDGGWYASVSHDVGSVYIFNPAALFAHPA